MSIRCLILDEKNSITDYAELNYPPEGGATIVPFAAETAEMFDKGDVVKFQYENKFDKVFDGVVKKNKKNTLYLDNVRSITNILQEDLRIEIFVDGVLTFEQKNKEKKEEKKENKDENGNVIEDENEDINEDGNESEEEELNEEETEDEIETFSVDITVKDVSSGGMGFYCRENLPMDRIYEYIAEWGATPIITKVKLLRKEKLDSYTYSYGCKFVDLYADEESILRGGVFAIQARRCQDRKRRENDIV